MLLSQNIYDRNLKLLEACAKDGYLSTESMHELNEMIILIYEGTLNRILAGQTEYSINEITNRTKKYIEQALKSYKCSID